ncbi:hypothetical protein [Gordonia soli]|uniref:Tat (Twin-arginine translocation) pathway signal sequence n=1 Tax=Gordonia soli NBRC 108243 TaxID=1223545 RepID=M0QQ39_9ACTN|nr:hypothetical protein [Gordonia soli]GAC70504.1 hypothetical protein GS4_35_00800 [Gordonia soli NBRC 108243]
MTTSTALRPERPTAPRLSSYRSGGLVLTAIALVGAFVLTPALLAGGGYGSVFDASPLVRALRDGFVATWQSGRVEPTAGLDEVVHYWSNYHLVKTVIALALLACLVILSRMIWRAYVTAGPQRQVALATSGVIATTGAVGALGLLMANIQATLAPLSALLPLLPARPGPGSYAVVVGEIRSGLSANGAGGQPFLGALVDDYARYHLIMAVIAAVLVVVATVWCVASWRHARRSDGRSRKLARWSTAISAVVGLGLAVLLVANTSTVVDPEAGLAMFFSGSW